MKSQSSPQTGIVAAGRLGSGWNAGLQDTWIQRLALPPKTVVPDGLTPWQLVATIGRDHRSGIGFRYTADFWEFTSANGLKAAVFLGLGPRWLVAITGSQADKLSEIFTT
jgi:hypothetical protein